MPILAIIALSHARTLAQVTTPIVQLLRIMDSEKPAMGKIYDRMFNIGERIRGINVDCSEKAADIHAERWEYRTTAGASLACKYPSAIPRRLYARTGIFLSGMKIRLVSVLPALHLRPATAAARGRSDGSPGLITFDPPFLCRPLCSLPRRPVTPARPGTGRQRERRRACAQAKRHHAACIYFLLGPLAEHLGKGRDVMEAGPVCQECDTPFSFG
eukprot:6148470-Pleurochrysis_carterae.AAC.1